MSVLSTARRVIDQWGGLLDQYRGIIPLAVLADWIARETCGNRFAVSRDPVLIEVGLSQVPLTRARALHCDPFDHVGACWLAGYEAMADVRRWRRYLDDTDKGHWLAACDRNLFYACQMDYSVGSGALKHLIRCAIFTAEKRRRGPFDLGLMGEIINFATSNDLSLPVHARHWGRQSPETIVKRCVKHRTWIDQAERIGPVDNAPRGFDPPDSRPPDAPDFPAELARHARTCVDAEATAEAHAAARQAVEDYAKARRRAEGSSPPPVVDRFLRLIRKDWYRRRPGDISGR